jgi:hypothetical protein
LSPILTFFAARLTSGWGVPEDDELEGNRVYEKVDQALFVPKTEWATAEAGGGATKQRKLPLVQSQGVILWNLNQYDAYPVGI